MAYSEAVADRVRGALGSMKTGPVVEKKMFGGIAFMVDDKMCVGVLGEDLMVRVGPEKHDEALRRPGARVMDFTHRPMVGFLFVSPDGFASNAALGRWVRWSLEYIATVLARKKPASRRQNG